MEGSQVEAKHQSIRGGRGRSAKVLPVPLGTVVPEHRWGTEARWDEGPSYPPGFWCQRCNKEYHEPHRSRFGCKCPQTSKASLQTLGNLLVSSREGRIEEGSPSPNSLGGICWPRELDEDKTRIWEKNRLGSMTADVQVSNLFMSPAQRPQLYLCLLRANDVNNTQSLTNPLCWGTEGC